MLGNTDENKFQFIRKYDIQKILEQLQLYSTYDRKNKSFTITIPKHRKDDLTREIDIIEEIGRIYNFQGFFNQISKKQEQQTQIYKSKKLKKIRNTLHHLGFNEVMNCCLSVNKQNQLDIVKIYNPINKEQTELRLNIIDNLVHNYQHNLKYIENNIEIFEIGKVFKQLKVDSKTIYNEKQSLGGLIYNNNYYRKNWGDKSNSITFFHAKGIIETLLDNINANTTLGKITHFTDLYNLASLNLIIRKSHRIGIYNKKTNQLIGILGELKQNMGSISEKKHINVFVFEIDIEELIKSIKKTSHLQYTNKTYSKYPRVTRDISVKIKQTTDIETVKANIVQNCKSFIESIDIFNEYTNNKTERFVGIRTTYRAQNRTLSTKDIKKLETNLKEIVNNLQAKEYEKS